MKHGYPHALLCLALSAFGTAALAQAKGSAEHIKAVTSKVDGRAIQANGRRTGDWPSYGLDYSESRFSRLAQVNAGNAKRLGLVWSYDLESTRGVEAIPLVADGVMYVTAPWSIVHAIDAKSGKRLWTYDPKNNAVQFDPLSFPQPGDQVQITYTISCND